MKVHFVSALNGPTNDYKAIVKVVTEKKHSLITDHYLCRKLEDVNQESASESEKYIRNVRKWMTAADLVIVETTKPDVSLGYEIAVALSMHKQTAVIYNRNVGHIPSALKGIHSDKFQLCSYELVDLKQVISDVLDFAENNLPVRFNLFISSQQNAELEQICENEGVSKASVVRKLIQDHNESHRF